jgi:pimeloyl-ACP methyl ester carboxylesterase
MFRPKVIDEWISTASIRHWPEPPRSDGAPAMLIPGFMAGDSSLNRMAKWLKTGGYAPSRPGVRWNVDCMGATVDAIEERLESVVAENGRRALVVGQSRGGVIGRTLAVRRPDLIESLVTLGSPLRDQLAIHSRTLLSVTAIGALGSLGVPGVLSPRCATGKCCGRARIELSGRFPGEVRFISIYSRDDKVVKFESCLDPAANQVEVKATHGGMGIDAAVWRAVSSELRSA